MKPTHQILLLVTVGLLYACSDEPATDNADRASAMDQTAEVEQATAETEEIGKDLMEQSADMPTEMTDPGEAFLHINAQKPGVKVTESGLQFEMLEQGDGKSPGPTSTVVTHYHGTFISGEVFDSSVDRGSPAEFPVNRVIPGWTEALQMMKEGDVWRLVLPSELAYGERGAGATIPPNSVLIFEVELIKVKD